jgi:hypothetical protein
MLGVARPAMSALPIGTIEGVVKNAQGQPLPQVQLTLRAPAFGPRRTFYAGLTKEF